MEVIVRAEDVLAEAVVRRLLSEMTHLTIYLSYADGGKGVIRKNIRRYCEASRSIPHILLLDLDRDDCPSALMEDFGFSPKQHPRVCLRIAIREVEAWLLADRQGLANFLGVPVKNIPANPEAIPDPKRFLVNLARKSKNRRLSNELVPATGSSAQVGPFYNARLADFIFSGWDVAEARQRAPSLERAISRISSFQRAS